MEKLTDAEVVKALERCLEDGYDHCSDCPYNEKVQCTFELMSDSLDLIKRKDAYIKELKKANEEMFDKARELYKEIEKLKRELTSADEVIGFREAEIERLNNALAVQKAFNLTKPETIKEVVKYYSCKEYKIKSAAYRELAREIKLYCYREFDEIIPSLIAEKIDDSVKELEESNG